MVTISDRAIGIFLVVLIALSGGAFWAGWTYRDRDTYREALVWGQVQQSVVLLDMRAGFDSLYTGQGQIQRSCNSLARLIHGRAR